MTFDEWEDSLATKLFRGSDYEYFAREAWNTAIESAAVACEHAATSGVAGPGDYNSGLSDGAARCQKAIRKLKSA